MRVTVLLGGPSNEREVSLSSGRAVAEALVAAGHEVYAADIRPDDLAALDYPCDVIFPVLHGAFGEDGGLQEILEQRNLPFVGSDSAACRVGMHKVASKRAWQNAGLPTPAWETITRAAPAATIPAPCVVKPIAGGSSIEVFICKTQLDTDLACDRVLEAHEEAMVEQFIEGPELTVGIVEERALDPIRIVCKRDFFDYDAKYKSECGTEHHFDLKLPRSVDRRCRELAVEANRMIGCRDLARVDFMIDKQNNPWLIEINMIPGFTPTSLLPEAAAHGGISFPQLVDRLVRRAYARASKSRVDVFISPPRVAARKTA
jgi:D-alanine-D-alanine ligase